MLPTYLPPTPEQIKQWLSYTKQGILARRFAMRALVYSDNAITKTVNFSLNKYDITLHPVEQTASGVFGGEQKYFPTFICELVSKGAVAGRGSIFDLYAALDQIMPLMGFDYELKLEHEM